MSEINLKKNLAFSSSSQIITIIAAFITNIFLARFLGPELRGRYVYLFTINSVVWILLDFGISKSFVYSLQHDKVEAGKLDFFSLLFAGILLVLSLGFFMFLAPLIPAISSQLYSRVILLSLGIYIVSYLMFTRLKFIYMGLNHIRDYAILSFLPAVLFMATLLPTFWLVSRTGRLEYAFILNVSIMVFCTILFQIKLGKSVQIHSDLDVSLIKRSYALGYKAFFSEYLIILMTRIDQLILKHLGTFTQLGIYTLSVNFVDMINTVCNMFGIVLLTKFTSLNDDRQSLAILRRIFLLIIFINLVCILGMAILGRFLITILYGSDYLGAYTAFMLLIPAIFGLTLGALFNTFLWSKGFPVFTIFAPIFPILIKVISSFFLVPKFGFYGAAISSSLSYPFWLIILLVWYFSTHPEQPISQIIPRKSDFHDAWQMGIKAKTLLLSRLGV